MLGGYLKSRPHHHSNGGGDTAAIGIEQTESWDHHPTSPGTSSCKNTNGISPRRPTTPPSRTRDATTLKINTKKHPPPKPGGHQKAFLATLFLAILAAENTASMLARRYAVGVIHLQFSKNAVLMMNEVLKLGFSLVFVLAQPPNTRGGGRDHGGRRKHLRRVLASSRPMAVPAVVYLIVNLVSYPALERINASVFTAISQLKVLATAFFAVLMLRTPISGRKWRTLTMMVLGVTLVSWESAPDAHHHSHSDARAWDVWEMVSFDYLVGIACAMAQTLLSGFASIYFEMVLKRKGAGNGGAGGSGDGTNVGEFVFSVWDRNIQLSVYSIAIYLPIAWFETNGAVLQGWTPLVWGIACLHASGGILVALAVLYTSSITKTVAVCASLVLTTVMGYVFFEAPLNGPIMLGCFIVVLAVFGYRDDCEVDTELERLRAAAGEDFEST